jgi:RNA polymerase sigma factor (sigma-70 family)
METLDTLVRAAQHEDREAFNTLVERFQDMACASAYAMLGDRQLAEDAAQEAFIEAYLTLEKLREPAAFLSWFRLIIFKQVDRLTRGKRLASSSLESAAEVPGTEPDLSEMVDARDVHERVRRAINTLPERQRLVVMLFYGTGYALKEIADFLEVPVTTIKKRLYDARQQLKDKLIDVMRDVLQEQRPSLVNTLPAKIRLLIAARIGDLDTVKTLLGQHPCLLNMKMGRNEAGTCAAVFLPVGITALHEAAMHDHAQVTSLLLAYGAHVDARTSGGMTPLHGAVMHRCHASAAILLTHDANVELPMNNGLTALHLVAMNGDIAMTHLLLARGATVDCLSQHGRTPSHWAALKGHSEIVRLLLAHGANPQVRDQTGRTPIAWAIARGYAAVVAMLQERTELS